MIACANTPAGNKRFRRACRGVPCLGALLQEDHALFGRSQPGRFYAGPSLALDIGGTDVLSAGGVNPGELAAFLAFCGCQSLVTSGTIPAGWHQTEEISCFVLEPGRTLPMPPAEEELWRKLRLEPNPKPGPLADFLYPHQPRQRDDFYSGLCTKRSRGLARVWVLMDQDQIAATVGAYAIWGGEAYLACGQATESLRGRGIGGRLIAAAASTLAAEGLRVGLLCSPQRVPLYRRLGFVQAEAFARCRPDETGKETNTTNDA